MRSSKHYAWLFKGLFLRLLEGIVTTSNSPIKIKCLNVVGKPVWYLYGDPFGPLTVYLRGNSKQRRGQRRAILRWLAEHRHLYEPPVETLEDLDRWAIENDGGNYWRGPKPR